jgi:hypothetical protein
VLERKVPRCQLFEYVAADLARPRLAEGKLAPGGVGGLLRQDDRAVPALAKREFERVGEPAALLDRRHQPVDDEFHHELPRAGARGHDAVVVEIADLSVQPHPLKPALPQSRQFVAQHARLGPHEGRQQHHALAGASGQDALHVIVERALHHAAAVLWTNLLPRERPEQLRVVGDLRRRRDRAARSARAGPLLDRQDRGEAVDEIDVGALQLIQHLARGRAQRLHVLAVALRVDGVERERRLARAAGAGDDHEFAPRQTHLEVLEVVLAGTFDVDVGSGLHAENGQRYANPRGVKAGSARPGGSHSHLPRLVARPLSVRLNPPARPCRLRFGRPFRRNDDGPTNPL